MSATAAGGNGAGPATNGSGQGEPTPLRLGGMALRNGLLIHGPTSWAVAARVPAGGIEVASGSKPVFARGSLARIPFLRGPLRLAEAVAVVPLARIRLASARLPFEDRNVALATFASLVASASLRRGGARRTVGREAIVAALGALPALAALRDPDLAAYHGVEHKAIGAYETGAEAAEMPKEHERCGSNLIVPLLALSIAGQVIVERLLERPSPAARGIASLAAVGVAVELFAYAERHPDSPVGRGVHVPGHEIQRLVSTREPTSEQLEVGEAALQEVLRAEGATADTV